MRERFIQPVFGLSCVLLTSCGVLTAATSSTTKSAATTESTTKPAVPVVQPIAPVKHEPVPPPPPPPIVNTTIEPPALPHPASVQPATTTAIAVAPTTQPGPIDDKVAYAIGYSVGRRIHVRLSEDGRDANNLQVLDGILAAMDDREPAYPREDIQTAFAQFQAYTLQRRVEKQYANDPAFRKLADDNLQTSHILMGINAQIANVESRPDGVQLLVLKPGSGAVLGSAKTLTVNLKVSLADGTLIKATDAGKPQKIATADCLPAVIDASRGMKVGAVWRVLVPADKAYGLAGKPPIIGPNEAIEYEIELIDASDTELKNQPSPPAQSRGSVKSADDYSDALQHLLDADAGVVRTRDAAMKDLQMAPNYLAAVRDLDTSFTAFNDKKMALLSDLERKDPRFGPMKKQAMDLDAEIDSALQNPATSRDHFDQLCKDRATFIHQWQDMENAAIDRAGLAPLRQRWLDASQRLSSIRDQQRIDVENADKLKAAFGEVGQARDAVTQARAALDGPQSSDDPQEDQAYDFIRRFPRYAGSGNDAWLTYGWSPIYGTNAAKSSAPVK